jgi:hypothetical protein
MTGIERIRRAYTEGCQQGQSVLRACMEWDLDEDAPPMEQAEDQAIRAYLAAKEGDLSGALGHAQLACELEHREYGNCATWTPLYRAIAAAASRERARVAQNEERNCHHV